MGVAAQAAWRGGGCEGERGDEKHAAVHVGEGAGLAGWCRPQRVFDPTMLCAVASAEWICVLQLVLCCLDVGLAGRAVVLRRATTAAACCAVPLGCLAAWLLGHGACSCCCGKTPSCGHQSAFESCLFGVVHINAPACRNACAVALMRRDLIKLCAVMTCFTLAAGNSFGDRKSVV